MSHVSAKRRVNKHRPMVDHVYASACISYFAGDEDNWTEFRPRPKKTRTTIEKDRNGKFYTRVQK